MMRLPRRRRLAMLALAAGTIGATRLPAQGSGACRGGGGGETAVAARVDATVLYERCLAGDRIAAVVLWRGRVPGWSSTRSTDSARVRANLARASFASPAGAVWGSAANDRAFWGAALDRASGRIVIRARDGDHPLPVGATDSVLVVMVDGVDAVAGPVVITTTRLAPASTSGIVPSREQIHAAATTGAPLPPLDTANRLRSMLMLDGFSRRFIAD
jgi:hypothetical protein